MAQKSGQEMNSRERRAAARVAAGVSVPVQASNKFVNVENIREAVTRVVEDEFKLVLESLVAKGSGANRTLEIIIDYAEGTESLSLDTVAEVTQVLTDTLDTVDDGEAPYTLEVSSPGATRPLTEPRHWRRVIGKLIDVSPAQGGDNYLARLTDVSDEGPVLARKKNTKKGQKESYHEAETVTWDLISAAKVEIEFNH